MVSINMGDTSPVLPLIDECLLEEQFVLKSSQVTNVPRTFCFFNCCLLFTASILLSLSIIAIQTYLTANVVNCSMPVSGILPYGFDNPVFEVSAVTGIVDFSKVAVLPPEIGHAILVWDPVTGVIKDIFRGKNIVVEDIGTLHLPLDVLVSLLPVDSAAHAATIEVLTRLLQ